MTDTVINLYEELPEFANEENQKIHAIVMQKSSELSTLRNDCNDLETRVNVLNEHLKNVQSEVVTAQQLLTARLKQAEDEKHMQQLAEREHGKIISEISKIQDQTQEIMSKVDAVQSKTVISQKRINEFKEDAKINQQELEQWLVVARQKEEDFLVLQRYHKEDEGKIRSMIQEIEKATAIIEAKKAELDQEITQTRALQIELDQTADHFRKMHDERAKLLSQWENTLQQILEELSIPLDDLLFVHSGNLGKGKKTKELLKAFSQQNNPHMHLVILGSIPSSEKEDLDKLINSDKRITFLGWKDESSLKRYIAASDLYLQPGTQSVTMMNALACGTPVMVFPHRSYQIFFNGCEFAVKNYDDICNTFQIINDNPDILRQKSVYAYEIAHQYIDSHMAAKTIFGGTY